MFREQCAASRLLPLQRRNKFLEPFQQKEIKGPPRTRDLRELTSQGMLLPTPCEKGCYAPPAQTRTRPLRIDKKPKSTDAYKEGPHYDKTENVLTNF